MSPEFTHRFIRGSNAAAPVLLLLHGTGGNEDSLLGLGAELLPSAHLLSPRGKVLEHGVPRFFRRLDEGVFDLEDLRLRTTELAAFIEYSRTTYDLPNNPIYAVGYSNGANIAANLLLTNPSALQGAVLFRAMLPDRPSHPISHNHTPVLILSGEQDSMIPPQSAEELAQILIQSGADVAQVWQATGHSLIQIDIDRAKAWLSSTL